jgi:hypothetical protein
MRMTVLQYSLKLGAKGGFSSGLGAPSNTAALRTHGKAQGSVAQLEPTQRGN